MEDTEMKQTLFLLSRHKTKPKKKKQSFAEI